MKSKMLVFKNSSSQDGSLGSFTVFSDEPQRIVNPKQEIIALLGRSLYCHAGDDSFFQGLHDATGYEVEVIIVREISEREGTYRHELFRSVKSEPDNPVFYIFGLAWARGEWLEISEMLKAINPSIRHKVLWETGEYFADEAYRRQGRLYLVMKPRPNTTGSPFDRVGYARPVRMGRKVGSMDWRADYLTITTDDGVSHKIFFAMEMADAYGHRVMGRGASSSFVSGLFDAGCKNILAMNVTVRMTSEFEIDIKQVEEKITGKRQNLPYYLFGLAWARGEWSRLAADLKDLPADQRHFALQSTAAYFAESEAHREESIRLIQK